MRFRAIILTFCLFSAPGVSNLQAQAVSNDPSVSAWSMGPFVGLLIAIAVAPLISKRWWSRHYATVSVGCAGATLLYYVVFLKNIQPFVHSALNNVSFIALVGSLFVVAGGILINTRRWATPAGNVLFLAIGGLLSNVVGTVGASMILIRPYLRSNRHRLRPFHVVFFIFIVGNIGGMLTPVGDPPLYLGFLEGIPFWWYLQHLWGAWLTAVGCLLALFFVMDRRAAGRSSRENEGNMQRSISIRGGHNFFFLLVVLLSVVISVPPLVRVLLMTAAGFGSYYATKREIHEENEFELETLKEVSVLFFGIFTTMTPALEWMEREPHTLSVHSASQMFWTAGGLSAVLDNAPTFLTFLSLAKGLFTNDAIVEHVRALLQMNDASVALHGSPVNEDILNTARLLLGHAGTLPEASGQIKTTYLLANKALFLEAISFATVAFGAMTYVGNAPNFLVKGISERLSAPCPTFLAYLYRYSLPILLPVLLVCWLLFFKA